jgi:hypothetical protein
MSVLVEANHVFLIVLLIIYSIWLYFRRKERGLLYMALGFAFLLSSTAVQMVYSLMPYYGVQVNIATLRFIELGSLALFVCFTVSTIIALKKISTKN